MADATTPLQNPTSQAAGQRTVAVSTSLLHTVIGLEQSRRARYLLHVVAASVVIILGIVYYTQVRATWTVFLVAPVYALLFINSDLLRQIISMVIVILVPVCSFVDGYRFFTVFAWFGAIVQLAINTIPTRNAALFWVGLIVGDIGVVTYMATTGNTLEVFITFATLLPITLACILLYYMFTELTLTKATLEKSLEHTTTTLENLRTFTRTVIHDLNNNLSPLFIASEMLNAGEYRKAQHSMGTGLSRCKYFSSRLRAVIRGKTFNKPITTTFNGLAAQIRGDIVREGLTVTHPDRLASAELFTDPHALSACVHNLVSNSFEAGARTVVVELEEKQNRLQIRVCDDGPGISGDKRNRLFSEQIDSEKPMGAGLGLMGVKYMLLVMGAEIKLVDSDEWSTVFEISGIPIAL